MKRKNIQQIQKNGDKITQTTTDIVLSFGGKRKVLSTSSLCGGIHTELEAVFNKSCYSEQYASGSGTDGVIVIGDMESNIKLFHANTDVRLGECIGKAVSNAVAEQLHLQMIYEEKYISQKSMSQEKAETFLSAYKYE